MGCEEVPWMEFFGPTLACWAHAHSPLLGWQSLLTLSDNDPVRQVRLCPSCAWLTVGAAGGATGQQRAANGL